MTRLIVTSLLALLLFAQSAAAKITKSFPLEELTAPVILTAKVSNTYPTSPGWSSARRKIRGEFP